MSRILSRLTRSYVVFGRRLRLKSPGWSVGRSEIHPSLMVTLLTLSLSTLLVSFIPGYEEFRAVAVSLPLIWLASLVVRLAAQQLAIGDFSHDFDTTICPTGNIQTDYEFLPPRAILAYGTSGQLASIGLMSVALVVNAAMTPTEAGKISLSELLDFQGGWGSLAWATQIFWVNLFLCVLHLLPTVPFDMRALIFSAFSWRSRTALEPRVFRRIAALNSHVAAMLMGVGGTTLVTSWLFGNPVDGWYAFVAASVYLFVASRWEVSRAEELEEQYVPKTPKSVVHKPNKPNTFGKPPHFPIEEAKRQVLDPDDLFTESDFAPDGKGFATEPEFGSGSGDQLMEWDVDELLRKVHRDGLAALSAAEQQALLSASKEIQDKRQSH